MKTQDIHLRDPFVLPVEDTQTYYLYGTTGRASSAGPSDGFNAYVSADLENWDGPIPVFRPPEGFWATTNFWAPEVHGYGGRYFMFASFKAPGRYRGTQILAAASPEGPFEPISDGPVTPDDWECLDGTLHVDADGRPWIVFCHEWVQIHNGAMCALPLSDDLTRALGRPAYLFSASEAPWVRRPDWPTDDARRRFPCYVTDGPFLFTSAGGELVMLWSSFGPKGYAMGLARSASGRIEGPWAQDERPVWEQDGGHGMIFRTFDGRLLLTFHMPNERPLERPVFVEIELTQTGIRLKSQPGQ